ncbi:MAG: tetratricopeptide repeat protein [Opitutia bacterium]
MRTLAPSLLLLGAAAALPAQVVTFKSGERWEVNNPFQVDAKGQPVVDARKARFNATFDRLERKTISGTIEVVANRRMEEVVQIEWPAIAQLDQARQMILRGEAAKALELVETVLRPFDKVKKIPGSPWVTAAIVKLDAIDRLDNDAALANFLSALETVDDGSNPELAQKIKLAKLIQKARRGEHAAVIADADGLISQFDGADTLARLHILKGASLLALKRYEDAMNTYLRVPVFYGSQQEHLPKALLGAAKAFRGMDSPATKSQRLGEVANTYLRELVATFPVSVEAEEAKALLPKEDRQAAEKAQSGLPGAAPATPQ